MRKYCGYCGSVKKVAEFTGLGKKYTESLERVQFALEDLKTAANEAYNDDEAMYLLSYLEDMDVEAKLMKFDEGLKEKFVSGMGSRAAEDSDFLLSEKETNPYGYRTDNVKFYSSTLKDALSDLRASIKSLRALNSHLVEYLYELEVGYPEDSSVARAAKRFRSRLYKGGIEELRGYMQDMNAALRSSSIPENRNVRLMVKATKEALSQLGSGLRMFEESSVRLNDAIGSLSSEIPRNSAMGLALEDLIKSVMYLVDNYRKEDLHDIYKKLNSIDVEFLNFFDNYR